MVIGASWAEDEECIKALVKRLANGEAMPMMEQSDQCKSDEVAVVIRQAVLHHELDSAKVPRPTVVAGWALEAKGKPQIDGFWHGILSPLIADCQYSISYEASTASDARVALVAPLAPTEDLKSVYLYYRRDVKFSAYVDETRFYRLGEGLDGLAATKCGISHIRHELALRAFDDPSLADWLQCKECLMAYAYPQWL